MMTTFLGITFVTLCTLHRWAALRTWGSRKRTGLEEWLRARPTLLYTDQVARTRGEITANATRRGRPRPANDSWIAACRITYGLPLATLNVKDFADYAEYDDLRLVGR
jgi:predicted nucleic acid-binding protein